MFLAKKIIYFFTCHRPSKHFNVSTIQVVKKQPDVCGRAVAKLSSNTVIEGQCEFDTHADTCCVESIVIYSHSYGLDASKTNRVTRTEL